MRHPVHERSSFPKSRPPQLARPGKEGPKPPVFLHWHHTLGNQAVQRLLRSDSVPKTAQAGLSGSRPGDPWEQEADRVADQVMRMAGPAQTGSAPAMLQRKCAECEEEEEKRIQTKSASSAHGGAMSGVAIAAHAAESAGELLPDNVRSFFEPRFGRDFSRVRVHADSRAAAAARAVQARAYTFGRDIVFSRGEYAPHTNEGKRLLAHELAHVIQQDGRNAALQRQVSDGATPDPMGDETPDECRHRAQSKYKQCMARCRSERDSFWCALPWRDCEAEFIACSKKCSEDLSRDLDRCTI